MNILLSEKCTNYCRYCFAQERMRSSVNNFISIDSFKYILDFLHKSKVDHVNLIGGEPLIHPNIIEILKILNDDYKIKTVSIFSGGILPQPKIFEIAKWLLPEKYNFIFNLNNREGYKNNHYNIIVNNIKCLRSSGLDVTISYNIYKELFNYIEIFEVCNYLGINKIRWSLAYPGIRKDTEYIHPVHYPKVRNRVYQFIMDSYNKGYELTLDCQIPLCFFTKKQMSKILFIYPQFYQRLGKCSPAIDVGTNLEVWRCFALYDDIKANLGDFNNVKEIYKFFKTKTDSHLYTEVPEYCTNCEYWKDRICQGGCLSFNIDLIKKSRQRRNEYEKLIDSHRNADLMSIREPLLWWLSDCIEDADALLRILYFILKKGDYDLIEEFYDNNKLRLHRLRNPVILYLIAIAFINKKDKKKALAVISEGLRLSQGSNLRQKFMEFLRLTRNELESFEISPFTFNQVSGI